MAGANLPFIFKDARLPDAPTLIQEANNSAALIFDALTSAGVEAPLMDTYYRETYYSGPLKNLAIKLRNATYHVIWALANIRKPLKDICLIDHGAGLGFIGLLAKKMGVGTVICNDIDPLFLEAAQGIARTACGEADRYILGDVDELINELNGICVDSLVSYDVIEHIYDLDLFFSKLCKSSSPPRVLFMSSGANMFSPRYIRKVFPIQRACELTYASKRTDIIKEKSPGLTEVEVRNICSKTRMLIRSEIELVVENYLKTGEIIIPSKKGVNRYDPFGTNTVDPETGWWAEHFFNPFYLTKLLRDFDFTAKIKVGYYGQHGSFLNLPINLLGVPFALPICSFYSVHAELGEAESDGYPGH